MAADTLLLALDEYDRLTGRTPDEWWEPTEADLARLTTWLDPV